MIRVKNCYFQCSNVKVRGKLKVGAGDLCQVTWRKGVRAVLGRRQPVASRATSKALRQGPVLAERARCPVSDRQGAVSQKSN